MPDIIITNEALEFSNDVETLVIKKKISYFDALLEHCELHQIEYDNISKLLTPSILSHLKVEAECLHLVKKSANTVNTTPGLPF